MRKFLLLSLLAFISVTGFSQDFSNKGKDFYLCFPSHVPNAATGIPTLSIYVTSDQASSGTITMGNGGFSSTFNLTAGNNFFQEITISSAVAQILNAESNVVGRKSIRVKTDQGQPGVVVYAQQWAGARSAATLVLPVNVLGKKYYAVSSSQAVPGTSGAGGSYLSKSHFQIIAINDNTTVQITPKYNGVKQTPFVVNLPLAGDIYQYEPPGTNQDITGSFIESLANGTNGCLPIAVFSGTSGVAIGAAACSNPGSSDPLFQQLYPVSTWGKNFGFISSANYPTGNPYRIVASENNTSVYLNGVFTAMLNEGEIYPNTYVANPAVLNYLVPTSITADKPISVAQFIQSNGCSGFGGSQGDPDMVVLNPIEQNIKDVTVFSSSNQNITQRFLNVLLKTNATASFKINGANPTGAWQVATNLPGYSFLRETFPGTGSYRLVADSGFNAVAYGYGANESYAYSAGTNVKDLNQQIELGTTYGIDNTPALCVGETFQFKTYFPVPNTPSGNFDSLKWSCASTALVINNLPITLTGPAGVGPAIDSTNIRNGKPVIWFSLPGLYSFNAPGTYTVTITTYKSTNEGCGNEQDYDFTITVFDPPPPGFTFTQPACYLEPVQFTESTSQIPKTTYSWYWNFGDPASGANNIVTNTRTPIHSFSAAGTYTVKYVGITTTGCITDTVTQQIVVPGVPTAIISGTTSACVNATPLPQITFTITGGTAPYLIDYSINNIAQPTVISATNVFTVNAPTNAPGIFVYRLDSVKNQVATLCKSVIAGQTATVTISSAATIAYQAGSGSTTQSVCINSPIVSIDYLIGGGGTGGTFTVTPALTGLTGTYNAATNIYTLQGTPTTAGTFTVTIKPTGPCVDPLISTTVTLTVNASATLVAVANASQTICSGNSIASITYQAGGGATGVTLTGLPATVTYTYNAGTGLVTITGTATATFTYTIQTVSTCANPAPIGGTITVNPTATIALQAASGSPTQTRCVNNSIAEIDYDIAGSITTVNVTGLPPGVNFVYTPGAPGVLKITGTPNTSVGSPFNYTVVLTGPCGVPPTSQTGILTVNPDATISLLSATASPTVCVNTTPVNIVYQVSGSVTAANLTGTLPPGVISTYVPGNPGSFTISGTPTSNVGSPFNFSIALTGGCQVPGQQTGIITVNGDATISAPTGPATQTVCVNTPIATISYTVGGSVTGVTFSSLPPGVNGTVTGSTVTITGIPTVVSNIPVVYNYTIATQGPCAKPLASGQITVNPDHTISSPVNNSQTVCANSAIQPIIYTIGGGATGITTITMPAGLTATVTGNTVTIQGSPTASGAYSIITSGNGCVKAPASGIITVVPAPTANFNYTTPTCDTRVITFTDNSTPNAGTITGYAWNFGDPGSGANNTSAAANPTHIFSTTGNHTVSLVVTTSPNSCSNIAFTRIVFVNDRPHADFTVPVACITDNVLFPDASTGANIDPNGYKWDFGDPGSGASNNTTTKDGQHIFSLAGTFTVKHIVTTTAGCTDTTSHTIFISSSPVADFLVNNATALCVNDTVSIVNKATIVTGTINKVEVYWDYLGAPGTFDVFNTPVLNDIYKHKYPNFQSPLTKQYSVRFRAFTAGSCVSEKIVVITVNAVPKVQFNAMPDACYDAAPFQITQASEVGGVPGIGVYSGPGVSPTGLFNPITAGIGTHTIKYTFTSTAAGCLDSMSSTIKVLDTAHAVFSYVNPLCEGNAVTFNEISTAPAGVTLNNTIWNFGDGSAIEQHAPGTTFTHNFLPGWGNYTVTMYNTSAIGCKSTNSVQQVYVNPNPVPAFNFVSTAGICLPKAAVSFVNNSTIADNSGLTYLWDFGDLGPTSSAVVPPAHIYTGTGPYTVTLTVRSGAPGGGCIKTTTLPVNFIHPQPKAAFTLSKPEVCIGQDVLLTDNTNGLDGVVQQWFWDLGDGIKRNVNPLLYTYTAANTYNVSLYIINSQGCNSDTVTQQFTVNPYPVVDAGPDAFVLEGGSYVLQPIVSGSTDYLYSWSPPTYLSSTTVANPTANIILDDITYTLFVTGRGGCPAPVDKVFIKVLKGPRIPNTFTPNGDGRHEKWLIQYLETYPNCRVQVFTRTGQSVFESRGYKEPWDGTLNGKPLPFDTYYYIIEPGNGRTPLTGYVTIIK